MLKKLALLFLPSMLSFAVTAEDMQSLQQESKQAISDFALQLKAELVKGMSAGGPVAAIEICHTAASKISQDISTQYGWKVTRTSLKVRNPKNTPDAWENKVLEGFEQRLSQGESAQSLEFSEIITSDEQAVYRYMKAIPTTAVCLACHGETLGAQIVEKLAVLYPEDKARGFKINDIRGAFSITRKLN